MIADKNSMDAYRATLDRATDKIRSQFPLTPVMTLVLGSGLGALADRVEKPVALPYADIPGFPGVTVPGHAGEMILGFWNGKPVAVLKGRYHAYEGHAPETVALPLRIMHRLGVRTALLTNAAGGLDSNMVPGDLMLIRDHIGLWADTPLRGLNLDEIGPRFPDQSQVYDRVLGDLAASCAAEMGIPLHQGVYAYCRGPQFETPAEIRLLKMLGASAVGMSTVPEAIAASHGGMRVLAVSCITNVPGASQGKPLSHQEVLEVGASASDRTIRLLERVLSRLDKAERESL